MNLNLSHTTKLLLTIIMATVLVSCGRKSTTSETNLEGSGQAKKQKLPSQILTFGIVPQQAPSQILRNWSPFAAEMTRLTGVQWMVKTAPSIPEFERRLRAGRYDVSYMNPYHYTVFSQKPGYVAFARQKNKRIKGIMVVKKDNMTKNLKDLSGTAAAFPSPAAFAASLLTRNFLDRKGIKVKVSYVKSHDSVYANVANGLHVVGGGVIRTFKATPKRISDKLRILWTSPGYTPHAFAVHPRVSPAVQKRIRAAVKTLETLPRDEKVWAPIRFKGLTSATDADWNDVRALNISALNSLLTSKSEPDHR